VDDQVFKAKDCEVDSKPRESLRIGTVEIVKLV
jgi:hypothetical protein